MKRLAILLILFTNLLFCQVKGNKQIETRKFELGTVEAIKINLYAEVKIDQTSASGMTITADSNLFEFIEKEVKDNTLNLDQIKWIKPSQKILIIIGAPYLNRVETGTHDKTTINLKGDDFALSAPIGKVNILGVVKNLSIHSELSSVDARQLSVGTIDLNIQNRGKFLFTTSDLLTGELSDDTLVIYESTPSTVKLRTTNNAIVTSRDAYEKRDQKEVKYITFKIRNNSGNRNHFVVVGPKPDGRSFSYGFPMMPYAVRKENWTNGTKVYKENALGFRKLIYTIKTEDSNKTINLFN